MAGPFRSFASALGGPRRLRLVEAVAPTTAAGEGAGFVSDGSGGLNADHQYFRPPSNGTPIDVSGGVSDFRTNVWTTWKKPCRVATTANVVSLAGGAPLTPDGVTVVVGDRVLVWQQSAGATNGIYRVTVPGSGVNGTWVRDTDFDADADVVCGLMVYIQEGSNNGQTRLTLTTVNPIVVGGTSLTFLQEAPLVRTDATSTAIITAATPFTTSIIWSTAVNMRDFSEISVWFDPTALGANTSVLLYAQWSDDGSTIPFDDDNGVQQTDFLISTGTDGKFKPKDYVANLTTATGELVAGSIKMLSFPKKGGSFRFGVQGNNASGTFGARAQRLA